AHGFLTLSLSVPLVREVFEVEGVRVAVNYGVNRVRFPAPVPVGSRLRVGVRLEGVEEIDGGVQVVVDAEFEIDGGTKPVCVAQ
ncbi:MAG: dehydratase, partial [Gemmatimonadetes bacterium]|nr:dehydratase [Gemmatimonadota bacterium]NIR37947.1 dehydratase [Actinomycetota bacterium]NIS32500.1 dehydratase [Actinomycetota bacterium]NIT96282.1 dehydratase [Actinomycetota bacterium]NIU67518.1 dehydratase [Actinomycetota bacterium]